MTPQEAIEELRDASDSEVRYGDKDNHYDKVMKRVEAFEMAIEALKSRNSKLVASITIKGEVLQDIVDAVRKELACEDCISRKETIEWLKKVTVTDGITFKTGFEQILYDIEQMPSVTPQQEVGKWNILADIWECSRCENMVMGYDGLNYCPNCGAKMEVEK